jgi:hypothetical protein
VAERGHKDHIWTGSANATDAGFRRNVELLVELVGPRSRFGINTLMEPQKSEVRFVNLLTDAQRFVASEQTDATLEALEQRLDRLREEIATAVLEARVTTLQESVFDMALVCRGAEAVGIDPDVTARCWPVTVTSSVGLALRALEPGETAATFAGLSFQAITSFFAFELAGRAGGEDRQVRFVVNVPLIGAPEGRREQVLRSLVRDRSRMLRFLWLLLADEGVDVPEMTDLMPRDAGGGRGASSLPANGLFEMLLRNLDRAPDRLDHLHGLLKELRHGEAGEDLLPDGFDEIWAPIWARRERLRQERKA